MPSNITKGIALIAVTATLTACDPSNRPEFLQSRSGDPAQTAESSTRLIERDVEAPEVFQITEAAVWDGRPSLGGVWVAHPNVGDPERVIIRNPDNGKFVIGSLFRKDNDGSANRLQVSSDAAAALGMSAAIPQNLNVTALRRAAENELEVIQTETAPKPAVNASLAPAPKGFNSGSSTTNAAVQSAAASAVEIKPQSRPSTLAKAFVQIGIFSVKANADRTAAQLNAAGIRSQVIAHETSGKKFWRVIAGPATSTAERSDLLTKVKARGFADAYSVSN